MYGASLGPPYMTQTATIANGQTTSNAIDKLHYRITALHMPAAFTGASISFLAAPTASGTYQQVVDEAGAPIAVTATAGKVIALDQIAPELSSLRFIKLVSSGAEGADRAIILELAA